MLFPDQYQIDADGFSIVGNDGTVADQSVDGVLHQRRMWPVTRYQIVFRVYGLTPTDISDLEAFYEANKFTTIQWVHPTTGVTYDAQMLGPPQQIGIGPVTASMEFRLDGVRVE